MALQDIIVDCRLHHLILTLKEPVKISIYINSVDVVIHKIVLGRRCLSHLRPYFPVSQKAV
jgi:hypothetical protein